MADEIRQVPAVVRTQLTTAGASFDAVAAAIEAARPAWVSIVARGTSDHAAIYARYLIETQLGWPVGLASPSITTLYHAPTQWANGLVLAVSQSGRSPDLVAVVEAARRGGALTVAVTNAPDSPLEAAAALGLRCTAGEERAVAATKSYVAELAAVARIVAALAPSSELAAALPQVPDVLAQTLAAADAWLAAEGRELVEAIATAGRALVVSRGFNLATALETALKLKETGRIFAEGYSAADLEHGPIALASAGFPTLAFRPDGPIGAAIDPAAERSRSLGARTWVVGGRDVAGQADALSIAALAGLPECLTPMALILPGQLLAEAIAARLGLSPDAPTGLHKVTLTR
ncbi:MAG TPA: SIS domain-containing protein [Candidatus Limnocylindrales bacterium]|nr:SIS domain-containing protein [Candidatus Limnocylindrales bacterium]